MLLNLTFCIAPTEIILLLRQTDQTSLSDSVSFMEVSVHRFVCSITILYEKKKPTSKHSSSASQDRHGNHLSIILIQIKIPRIVSIRSVLQEFYINKTQHEWRISITNYQEWQVLSVYLRISKRIDFTGEHNTCVLRV